MSTDVKIFSGFERFWHWSQATLLIVMLITGFDLHGTYSLMGFSTAFNVHLGAAIALILLWLFAIFWHVVTGEWEQYKPTLSKFFAMVWFYTYGIFTGAPHPVERTRKRKHNPIQRFAYFSLLVMILPTLWATGLLRALYNFWPAELLESLPLEVVAWVHTGAAFALAAFLIVHLYMITTGHTVFEQLRSMITGYGHVDDPAQ